MQIISFGKSKASEYEAAIREYSKRLSKELKIIELNHHNGNKNEIILAEAKALNSYLNDKSYKVFLDARGKQFSSEEFSQKLTNIKSLNSEISFFIGGAYGFSVEILAKADLVISLGKMTLPHMLARVMLLEQIYRAKMIEVKHPYHK